MLFDQVQRQLGFTEKRFTFRTFFNDFVTSLLRNNALTEKLREKSAISAGNRIPLWILGLLY